ncbi:short-chain dehydrogenase [Pseudobacillus wudalianchiensis]|uniref:Short-chain dehydrogenase n=1 Tax=Pseudobacillus wudalianchiensis TaxID=1743143 RepID=A0A1B9AIW7_9BACI|nr:short-chain dehydrogenase [Bacillus wudalianchiensis]OCA83776.1 short-chain dehydrogenase [Bacillus wudalianchiensis]
MPCVHEFGILDAVDSQKDYDDYDPQKYNCISVDDDLIFDLNEQLATMKTYFHSLNRPEYGLAYCGITIIPPESLSLFYDVVTSSISFNESAGLNELAAKIIQAAKEKKYMIHYGI